MNESVHAQEEEAYKEKGIPPKDLTKKRFNNLPKMMKTIVKTE